MQAIECFFGNSCVGYRVCLCVCVCTYTCPHMHTHKYKSMWVHTDVYVGTDTHICTRVCRYLIESSQEGLIIFIFHELAWRKAQKRRKHYLQSSIWKNFFLFPPGLTKSQPSWLVLCKMVWHYAAEPSLTAVAGLCSWPSSHPCTCLLPHCQKVCWLSLFHGYCFNLPPEAHEH